MNDKYEYPTEAESEENFAAFGKRIAGSLKQETHAQWWRDRVDRFADNVLVKTDRRNLTYAEVDRIATQVAGAAHAAGVRSGDTVAIQLPASAAFLTLLLGLSKVGVRYSLLGTALRGRSLQHALEEVPVKHVFTTPSGSERIRSLGFKDSPTLIEIALEEADVGWSTTSGIDRLEAWLRESPGDADWESHIKAQNPSDTLFYIFTSGTTGLPKATQCSHGRYLAGAASEAALLDMSGNDCMYVVLPMFHIAALSASGAAISVGGSVLIRPKFSASRYWQDVRSVEATCFQYLGEILRYLLSQPVQSDAPSNTLRAMIGAGVTARIWSAFEERFGPIRIVESYGSSEGVFGIFNLDGVVGSVGRAPKPLEERLRIVEYDHVREELARDDAGWLIECDANQSGELIARLESRDQFEGYSSDAATRKKLIEGAFLETDLWYRSGDLFRKNQGYYFFESRLGDTFRWKGENVSAREVADALSDCGSVDYAAVYGVAVPNHEGNAGMALIAMTGSKEFGEAERRRLYDQLCRDLPSHAHPLFIRVGDGSAVLTDTYKVGIAAMKRQGYSRQHVQDPIFIVDRKTQTYVKLTDDALREAGLPDFEIVGAEPNKETS